jgi:hypothetical protein
MPGGKTCSLHPQPEKLDIQCLGTDSQPLGVPRELSETIGSLNIVSNEGKKFIDSLHWLKCTHGNNQVFYMVPQSYLQKMADKFPGVPKPPRNMQESICQYRRELGVVPEGDQEIGGVVHSSCHTYNVPSSTRAIWKSHVPGRWRASLFITLSGYLLWLVFIHMENRQGGEEDDDTGDDTEDDFTANEKTVDPHTDLPSEFENLSSEEKMIIVSFLEASENERGDERFAQISQAIRQLPERTKHSIIDSHYVDEFTTKVKAGGDEAKQLIDFFLWKTDALSDRNKEINAQIDRLHTRTQYEVMDALIGNYLVNEFEAFGDATRARLLTELGEITLREKPEASVEEPMGSEESDPGESDPGESVPGESDPDQRLGEFISIFECISPGAQRRVIVLSNRLCRSVVDVSRFLSGEEKRKLNSTPVLNVKTESTGEKHALRRVVPRPVSNNEKCVISEHFSCPSVSTSYSQRPASSALAQIPSSSSADWVIEEEYLQN